MRAMHPQAERMPPGVTELAADYSGPVDVFTAPDARENGVQRSPRNDMRQGGAKRLSSCCTCAPAMLAKPRF